MLTMYPTIFLFGLLCFFQCSSAKDSCVSSDFSLNGDYILGGLFKVHSTTTRTPFPVALECDKFPISAEGYARLQVMRFAVEEINNSTSILPDVSLGYEIFDHCSDTQNFPSVFEFLSKNSSVKIHPNYTERVPKVMCIIGPYGSSETITIAPFFMPDLLPMVNYGSSSSALSDKKIFPSFQRTLTDNGGQIQLVIDMLQKYKWNWIAYLSCDNDYCRDAFQLFIDGIRETSICLAYQKELTTESNHDIIFRTINSLRINVIIVYASTIFAVKLIESAIPYKIQGKVWIASITWSLNKGLSTLKGIDTIGTVIGITERVVDLPGYPEFVKTSQGHNKYSGCKNRKLQDFRATCNQACSNCSDMNPSTIINVNPSFHFPIYSGVYVVAKALHNMLHCGRHGCNQTERVFPYKLLKEIRKSDFKLLNLNVNFDENGDPPSRYNIVTWNPVSTPTFQYVGSYDPGSFIINENLIHWYTNGTIPVSRCSKDCEKGSARRLYGIHTCCFECDICPNSTYINESADPYRCIPCKKTEWADAGSTSCTERVVEYVRIMEPLAILVLLSVSFMLFLAAAIAVLFAHNYSTPVVRSAGGNMCFLILGCLSCSGLSVFFYIGIPTQIKCALRSIFFPVFYTICLSCLTVRSFQIVCVFKMAAKLPRAYDWWVKNNGQWLFIAVASTVQLLLCALSVPRPFNDTVSFKDQIIMNCDKGIVLPSSTSQLFAGLLGMLCFTFSYMGTDLPKNYNEAKSITFSVLLFYISWISYYTVYSIYKGKHLPIFNAISMLTSSNGILLSYFGPKSYVILFKPEKNTQAHFKSAIQDYTQKISRM